MTELPEPTEFGSYGDWPGRAVLDSGGRRLGEVREIYLDDATDRPEWVLVDLGGEGTRFVPLADASVEDDAIRVAQPADRVQSAPGFEASKELTQDAERQLYTHYGLRYSEDASDSLLPAEDQPGSAGGADAGAEAAAAAGTAAAGVAGTAPTGGAGTGGDETGTGMGRSDTEAGDDTETAAEGAGAGTTAEGAGAGTTAEGAGAGTTAEGAGTTATGGTGAGTTEGAGTAATADTGAGATEGAGTAATGETAEGAGMAAAAAAAAGTTAAGGDGPGPAAADAPRLRRYEATPAELPPAGETSEGATKGPMTPPRPEPVTPPRAEAQSQPLPPPVTGADTGTSGGVLDTVRSNAVPIGAALAGALAVLLIIVRRRR